MEYDLDTLGFPNEEELNEKQLNFLNNYKEIYAQIKKNPGDYNLVKAATRNLALLFDLFPKQLKEKYIDWYRYHVTLVDPLAGPCIKMSELLIKSEIAERVGVSQNGKEFMIPLDGNDSATARFLQLLAQELPNLKFKMVKL